MVVALEDIVHETVQVLGKAVELLVGSRLRIAIAVYHMDLAELRCLCNSSRLLARSGRQTGCWGIDSTLGAVWEQEDHTWHQPGCMYSKGAPRAYGRSIARLKIASREDQVVCLEKLTSITYISRRSPYHACS